MTLLTTEQRARVVGSLYGHTLDRGVYWLSMVRYPDEDAEAIIGLTNAMLDAEAEHREWLWVYLEEFLSFVPTGGIWQDALVEGSAEDCARATYTAVRCAWLPERLRDDEDTP